MNLKIDGIFEKCEKFGTGVRLVMLIDRAVSNTNNGSRRWHKKFITNSPDEFQEAVDKSLDIMIESELPKLRLYSSVNERYFEKGERYFRLRQIEIETLRRDDKIAFYQDIHNNFFSCLAKPTHALTKNFLLDVDYKYDKEIILANLPHCDVEPLYIYPTPNGWHVITKPFNPNNLSIDKVTIIKDGLMLLAWNE